MGERTFVTKYALVLASIAKTPDKTAREIGDDVGVTERTANKIILDLEEDCYITKTKVGIKTHIEFTRSFPLNLPILR